MAKKTERKQRILIVVTSDLTTDQRVLKIADTFHRHNREVLLIGRELPDSRDLQLPYAYRRMRLIFRTGFMFYLEFNIRLFIKCLFNSYDLLYANDTDTLPASFIASRIRFKPLIFDAHELFPEVPELQGRRLVKKVWQTIEDFILPRLNKTVTVCDSIAEYYNKRYAIPMQVVRNVPYYREQLSPVALPVSSDKKIILYQGALNKGRGLEWVINAMPLIDNAVLYIIGDGDLKKQLEAQVKQLNISEKVIFHGKVAASELHRFTPSAHLGLCLLDRQGMSYYYALPNRIFDYIQAGVPVLATPFPEIRRIVETYHTGILTDDYTPEGLATTITSILKEGFPTEHFKQLAAQLCWEKEEEKLLLLA